MKPGGMTLLLLGCTAHAVAADNCTIIVSTSGAQGTVSSPEAARTLRRSVAFRARCGSTATILLEGGATFYVTAPPLRLDARDTDTVWTSIGDTSARLSAGTPVADSCWQQGALNLSWRCAIGRGRSFRSVTLGGRRLRQARWPDYDSVRPFTGGWLFVNSSRYDGNGTFTIGVATATLPPFARTPGWAGATISIFPTRSWINLVGVSIRPVAAAAAATAEERDPSLRHFVVQCPSPSHMCSNTSNSASFGPGNRFFFEGDRAALSAGEWVYDPAAGDLLLGSHDSPLGVVIPLSSAVVVLDATSPPTPPSGACHFNDMVRGASPGSSLARLPTTNMSFGGCQQACCARDGCLAVNFAPGADCYLLDRTFEGEFRKGSRQLADRIAPPPPSRPSDVSFRSLAFVDTDFTFNGYQEGFSHEASDPGMPRDAALVIASSDRVTVSECTFQELSGGGIHITNASAGVIVSRCRFENLGQTGVAISGGADSQPRNLSITHNTFEQLGLVLASAAGIVASSASFSNFSDNNITGTPRWGIAIRSDGTAIARGNRVERNRLFDLARSTRDLGGLSFIGAGHTGTVVRHNCVKRVIGMDTDTRGAFNRPYFTWGVYLDNFSSNFTVDSNVLSGNVLGAVFVHGGNGNTITNNVAHNTSNASMPPDGHYGHCAGSQGLLLGQMRGADAPAYNVWAHNIVLADTATRMSVVALTQQLNWSLFTRGLVVEGNTYWSRFLDLTSEAALTPLGGWDAWQAAGWDRHGSIADPLFVGAELGDFRLRPTSPALKAGFVPLPAGVDQC